MPPHRETSHRAHASGGQQQHFPPLSREEVQPPTNNDSHFTTEESAKYVAFHQPFLFVYGGMCTGDHNESQCLVVPVPQ